MKSTRTMIVAIFSIAFISASATSHLLGQCQGQNRISLKPGQSSCSTRNPPVVQLVPGQSPVQAPVVQIPTEQIAPKFAAPAPINPIDDSALLLAGKEFQCEVKVQHPMTFDWYTAKSFKTRAQAESFKSAIESRYWIIYERRDSEGRFFLEAANQQDSTAKTSALKASGSIIRDVRPMTAQVVEESIQSLMATGGAAEQDRNKPIEEARLARDLTGFLAAKPQSVVPSELLPLMGLWQAVSESATSNAQRVLLNLEETGYATLTVPNSSGGETTVHRPFAIEDGMLNLKDGEKSISMGKVVSADANKVVLERAEGILTFVRPD